MAAALPLEWQAVVAEPVVDLSWSSDGRWLAAGGVDGAAALLTAAGAVKTCWTAHPGGLFQCAFSPSQPWLATSGADGRAALWRLDDLAGGAPPQPAPPPAAKGSNATGWAEHLRWQPQGARYAFALGRRWVVGDPAGTETELPVAAKTIGGLAWHPEGSLLAAGSYGQALVAHAATGELRQTLPTDTALISMSWSPDGRWIAGGTNDATIAIWPWPFREGEELAMSGFPGKVRHLSWHPSGKYLANGAGNEVMVWDCSGAGPAGREPRGMKAHAGRVTALAYQRQGHLLASGDSSGRIRLWNARKSAEPLAEAGLPAGITSLAWSPGDATLAVGDEAGHIALLRSPA